MGALSRVLALGLSVGLAGCTAKTMPAVTELGALAGTSNVAAPAAAQPATQPTVEPAAGYGWLNLRIRWPEQPGYSVALLPTTTQAIAVWVKQGGVNVVTPTVISRQAGATSATASIRVEAATNLSVEIKAYREAAPDLAASSPIAQNSQAGVNVVRSKATPLTITLNPLDVPTVSGFSANVGRPGDTLTLTGTKFGSGDVPVAVSFNGVAATSVNRLSETSLTVVVPTGATTGNVVVTADGVSSDAASTFWVLSSFEAFASRASWDTATGNLYRVKYGESLQLSHRESWVLKALETADQYGTPPGVGWTSSNALAGTLADTGLFSAGTAYATTSVQASMGSIRSGALELDTVGVNGVSLDQDSLTLNALPSTGAPDAGYVTSATLVATVDTSLPFNGGVNWSSSDTNRVTVSNGLVQTTAGAAEGTVTITARSVDDSTKQATASVTVTRNGGLVLGIE